MNEKLFVVLRTLSVLILVSGLDELTVMETLPLASHHRSQLWALHPHLLQVTWPLHRVPIGLLTWVTAVRQSTWSNDKMYWWHIHHFYGVRSLFSRLYVSPRLPPCRLRLSVRVHRRYLRGSDRSLLLQTKLHRRELRLLRQRLRQLPRLLPWVTATETLSSGLHVPTKGNTEKLQFKIRFFLLFPTAIPTYPTNNNNNGEAKPAGEIISECLLLLLDPGLENKA